MDDANRHWIISISPEMPVRDLLSDSYCSRTRASVCGHECTLSALCIIVWRGEDTGIVYYRYRNIDIEYNDHELLYRHGRTIDREYLIQRSTFPR